MMRYVRVGFIPEVEDVRVSVAGYDLVRSELFDGCRSVIFSVPKGRGRRYERIIVSMFLRSCKPMSRPVIRYVSSKRVRLYHYVFAGADVVVEEWLGKDLLRICFSRDADRWLRLSVIRVLMSQNDFLARYLPKARRDDLLVLSRLWEEYAVGGSIGQFAAWIKNQPLFTRIVRYNRCHSRRVLPMMP